MVNTEMLNKLSLSPPLSRVPASAGAIEELRSSESEVRALAIEADGPGVFGTLFIAPSAGHCALAWAGLFLTPSTGLIALAWAGLFNGDGGIGGDALAFVEAAGRAFAPVLSDIVRPGPLGYWWLAKVWDLAAKPLQA